MATVREDEAFLREFHAARPAVTVRAMAHGRAADGRSSYEILRDRVAACGRVLDLGCGDGLLLELLAEHRTGEGRPDERRPGERRPGVSAERRTGEGRVLAGLDLPAEELALARRRPGIERADLRVGGRSNSPSRSGSSMAVYLIWR